MPPLSLAPSSAAPVLANAPLGPVRAELPPGVDLGVVLGELTEGGVSTAFGGQAGADAAQGLREVVGEAAAAGVDLKVVVIEGNPGWIPTLRDLATDVGAAEGGTVLVLSPNYAGTYSDEFPRIELQSGEIAAVGKPPVQAAEAFVESLEQPGFPWTALTLVLLALVAAAVVATRLLRRR